MHIRRAFYDKRLSQEVLGDALGEVRTFICSAAQYKQSFVFCIRFIRSKISSVGIQRLRVQDYGWL